MALHYVTGDATRPQGGGTKIIAHICNDVGGWGAGFVLAISRRWPGPKAAYRTRFRTSGLNLGNVEFIGVESDIFVANMVAQHDIRWLNKVPPIRYLALHRCLTAVAEKAITFPASVHMPRIGAGLAGGDWARIEDIIKKTLAGVEVYIYDLPGRSFR